ncbi:response regulator transcription factor [Actinomyces sp. oral taxon 448]|jgi:response regulator containing a cheY-like receiver domain and an HTH DNA-binding domain|uniref:response regulator transcription factor n=1 Tax=Actinomyces sp. oral taxon 448 TaxID=712124 RepID=UPI0025BEC1AF|nr:response regulator transcription factor [Actinomyces sp. oral taxon 448]
MSTTPSLVLADDSALLREGLAGLLERQGYDVVARESDAHALVDRVELMDARACLPDAVIADVRMPPTMRNDGLEAALTIRRRHPAVAIMVLSQYVSAAYARRLFSADAPADAGGTGYLLKDRVSEVADFLGSLRVILSGGMVTDPEVARAMVRSSRSGLANLTPRELEVLELMARGLSNSQIAVRMVVSGAAVAKHVSAIFLKLGLDPSEENRRVRAILAFLGDGASQ